MKTQPCNVCDSGRKLIRNSITICLYCGREYHKVLGSMSKTDWEHSYRSFLKESREVAWKWVQEHQDELPWEVKEAMIAMFEFHRSQSIKGAI